MDAEVSNRDQSVPPQAAGTGGGVSAPGYLTALAEFAGAAPDADGIATVEFGAVTVHLAQPEALPGRVAARAEIGPVDDLATPETYLEKLLAGSYFGNGLDFTTPSVADGVAYLTVLERAERLDTAEALETFVKRFVILVREWRTRLSLCGKTAAEEADPAPEAPEEGTPVEDIPVYERIMV